MLFQTVLTISALITAALATPVDIIEKRSQQVQACGNNLNQMCCDSFQVSSLFNFLPVQIGNNCNQMNCKSLEIEIQSLEVWADNDTI